MPAQIIVASRQRYLLELQDAIGHLLLLFDITLVLDGGLHLLHHLIREECHCLGHHWSHLA